MKRAKPFATEADLCARFIAAIGPEWVSYPETCNWDTLLVRKVDGFQIGIQAKLKLNTDVINQALEEYGVWDADRMAPDCRAILVPADQGGGFGRICTYIGLTIIRVTDAETQKAKQGWGYGGNSRKVFDPDLPSLAGSHVNEKHWFEWAPMHRHRLPDYVPDVVAGSPSPVQLTNWKICAIKIAVILERRGFLTRADFKHVNIDHRRWLPSGAGWLALDGGVYRKASYFPDFKMQHPRVYDEIAADYETWKPADPIPPLSLTPAAKQETML